MFVRFTKFGREIRKLLERRIECAKQAQGSESLLHDPIEDDPLYQDFLQAAKIETDEELQGKVGDLSFCHLFSRTQQTILVRKYGVIWFTPEEMNPHSFID